MIRDLLTIAGCLVVAAAASAVIVLLVAVGHHWRTTAIDRQVDARMAAATGQQIAAEYRLRFYELIAAVWPEALEVDQ